MYRVMLIEISYVEEKRGRNEGEIREGRDRGIEGRKRRRLALNQFFHNAHYMYRVSLIFNFDMYDITLIKHK